MVEELAGPGVEYADHPEAGADEPWILSQLLQGRGGSAKEQVVDRLLIAARERAQLGGQGKGDQKVSNRQQQTLLRLQPSISLFILALGAVAVLAGVIAVALLLALGAVIELAAQTRGAAAFNVLHGAVVRGQHAVAELSAIGWAMQPEDVSHFQH